MAFAAALPTLGTVARVLGPVVLKEIIDRSIDAATTATEPSAPTPTPAAPTPRARDCDTPFDDLAEEMAEVRFVDALTKKGRTCRH